MDLKKKIIITLISVTLLCIVSYLGILITVWQKTGYKSIDEEIKINIENNIKKCLTETPNLQTNNSNIDWNTTEEEEQVSILKDLLENMTLIGEYDREIQDDFIIADYKELSVIIQYLSESPEEKIILKVQGTFYKFNVEKKYLDILLEYLEDKELLIY